MSSPFCSASIIWGSCSQVYCVPGGAVTSAGAHPPSPDRRSSRRPPRRGSRGSSRRTAGRRTSGARHPSGPSCRTACGTPARLRHFSGAPGAVPRIPSMICGATSSGQLLEARPSVPQAFVRIPVARALQRRTDLGEGLREIDDHDRVGVPRGDLLGLRVVARLLGVVDDLLADRAAEVLPLAAEGSRRRPCRTHRSGHRR